MDLKDSERQLEEARAHGRVVIQRLDGFPKPPAPRQEFYVLMFWISVAGLLMGGAGLGLTVWHWLGVCR